ncbi:MAG: hypothetical protein U9P61_02315, partial [Patescibacteria group bacterium]|nr:hypothetical protein [Patescibacteria group bacterium]
MKKDFYKKIFYIPLVVFFFLSITAFVFYINQQTTVIGDYSHPVPKRLDVIVDEIEKTLYDIVGSETGDDLFSEATSLMEDADCQYAKSLCREGDLFTTSGGLVEVRKCSSEDLEGDSSVIGSLWSSKAEERDFHTKQGQLKEEKEQLEFLQNILKKEMNHGIAKDIEQMRIQGMDDEADEVERELGILLFLLDPNDSETREILDDEIINEGETRLTDAGIDPSSESIIQILNKVVSISTEGGKALCAHACVNDYEHISFTFCFNLTEQSKIDLVFNIKLEIEDLEIDPIEIKEIVLSLPEEVEIPEVRLQFSIPIPDIIVEEDDISLKVDPYPKKGFYSEGIKLSCPEHENHSLSYEDVDIIEEINPTELKWYFELLEFLYNGCNDITST